MHCAHLQYLPFLFCTQLDADCNNLLWRVLMKNMNIGIALSSYSKVSCSLSCCAGSCHQWHRVLSATPPFTELKWPAQNKASLLPKSVAFWILSSPHHYLPRSSSCCITTPDKTLTLTLMPQVGVSASLHVLKLLPTFESILFVILSRSVYISTQLTELLFAIRHLSHWSALRKFQRPLPFPMHAIDVAQSKSDKTAIGTQSGVGVGVGKRCLRPCVTTLMGRA